MAKRYVYRAVYQHDGRDAGLVGLGCESPTKVICRERATAHTRGRGSFIVRRYSVACIPPECMDSRVIAATPDLIAAATRALPWLGLLISEEMHLKCASPSDAVRTLRDLEAALAKAGAL